MALSTKKVAALIKKGEKGRYHDGRGVYLQIAKSSAASFVFRYERAGRDRLYGLGSAQDFSLEEARSHADDARAMLYDNIDPIDARQRARAKGEDVVTFGAAAQMFHEDHRSKWKNAKHAAQFLSTLRTFAFPVIEKKPVCDVVKADVLKILRPIWHTKTETATRVRSRIESVLDFAKVHDMREGDNPASWKLLRHALPAPTSIKKVVHHPALPINQMSEFMRELEAAEGTAARALEFTILTVVRTSEALGAKRAEFDFEAAVWTVPGERMKMKVEHRVPLSARAVKLLKALPGKGEYLFPGLKPKLPLSNMAMLKVIERMNSERERAGKSKFIDPTSDREIVPHGFRSTFRDWAGDCTSYPHEVIEMALAHAIENKTEAAYRRSDALERRAPLMEDWATFIHAPEADKSSNVTPLRKKRA